MRHEKSCGAVVYKTTENGIRFYIIRSRAGIWGFPKGHVEPGESERQTASREIKEETGLSVRLLRGFVTTEKYILKRRARSDTVKKVVYFLAEADDGTPQRQETEISEIRLVSYDEAMSMLQYESSRRILTEAWDHLASRGLL